MKKKESKIYIDCIYFGKNDSFGVHSDKLYHINNRFKYTVLLDHLLKSEK